jgi:PRTRC genetic system protein B
MSNSVKVLVGSDKGMQMAMGIILYRSEQGHVCATTHGVQIDANVPSKKVLGPGTLMTKKQLRSFARTVDSATAFAGFIPECMLYNSPDLIAWWAPAAIRPTWFVGEERGIGEVNGPAAHPAVVFVATPRAMYVFALLDSTRPDATTVLCKSPHFNVWEGGQICTGNVELPPALGADALDVYEDGFFRSRFTHTNQDAAVNYKGGMIQLWRDQLAKPDPERMNLALKPTKETLGAAIKRIATKSSNHT